MEIEDKTQPEEEVVRPQSRVEKCVYPISHKIILIFAIISSTCMIGILFYFFGQNKIDDYQTKCPLISSEPNENVSEIGDKESASSELKSDLGLKGTFVKRNYDVSEKFFDSAEDYPSELIQYDESSLVGIKCTPRFFRSGDGNYYAYNENGTEDLSLFPDRSVSNIISQLSELDPDTFVAEISVCSTESNKTIILWSVGPCGGGCSGIPYVGVVEDQSLGTPKIDKLANIFDHDEKSAYYGCREPLALTVDNDFYFKCNAGDGGGMSASAFKINLVERSIQKLVGCESSFNNTATAREIICKYY